MTKHTITRKARATAPVYGVKSLAGVDGNPDGTFEAIVAVFSNVDLGGDRIIPGAFGKSLERWKSSGDPIPVIFAHRWDDLDSHIGEVLESRELPPGDPALPPELSALGGLWTKFSLELDEPFAARVAKKLAKRTLREFSFAYDVISEQMAADGALELLELDVIEVGPCLKGMNPATSLLSRMRKSLGKSVADLTDEELEARILAALEKIEDAGSAGEEDPAGTVSEQSEDKDPDKDPEGSEDRSSEDPEDDREGDPLLAELDLAEIELADLEETLENPTIPEGEQS